MDIEEWYIIVGELYVAQRRLQHECATLAETNNQMRVDGAELQERLSAAETQNDIQAADIEMLARNLPR